MKLDIEKLKEKEFWIKLNPKLHVDEKSFSASQNIIRFDQTTLEEIKKEIIEDGYFQINPVDWGLPLNEMKLAVRNFYDMGLPTPFVFVYDEFFLMPYKVSGILSFILGNDFKILPDFWAWYVDPLKAEKGWEPHRDTGIESLFETGMPKSLTVWVPLTNATPKNGCIYIVPAQWDPYFADPANNYKNFQHQHIRALPAEAGSILGWNQAVIHWGGRSSKKAKEPRISFAFEFQRGDVTPLNEPLLPYDRLPDLNLRLQLIGKQILQYEHMYPLRQDIKEIAIKFTEGLKIKSKVHS